MKDEYDLTGGIRGKYYKQFDVASCGCRPIGWSDDAAPIMEFCPTHKAAPAMKKVIEDLLLYFKSGNSIPRPEAYIKSDSEWVINARNLIDEISRVS